ncbi:hypothetical protein FACS1894132_13880 [Clostridia bacterium]|nr:hypothetical protein FACS1894132_13880 [Clostridia bacterium]
MGGCNVSEGLGKNKTTSDGVVLSDGVLSDGVLSDGSINLPISGDISFKLGLSLGYFENDNNPLQIDNSYGATGDCPRDAQIYDYFNSSFYDYYYQ